MMYGPQAAFIAEQFPNRIRYAGASLAYTLAGIFGGGIAPVMFAGLMKAYGRPFAISVYAAVALLITGGALSLSRPRSLAPPDYSPSGLPKPPPPGV
jgi:MFS family permease